MPLSVEQFVELFGEIRDDDFEDLPINTRGLVLEIVRKFKDDEMKPITYSQACIIKTE